MLVVCVDLKHAFDSVNLVGIRVIPANITDLMPGILGLESGVKCVGVPGCFSDNS